MERALLFVDYDDGRGGRFSGSPGLLPFFGHVRSMGFRLDLLTREAELVEELRDPAVRVVGVSSMERLLDRSVATAARVRAARPEVVLLLGGSSIGPFARDLAAHQFDIVVVGEAEHVLPALLGALLDVQDKAAAALPLVSGGAHCARAASPGGALDRLAVDRLLETCFVRRVTGLGPARVRAGGVYIRDSTRGAVWRLDEPAGAPVGVAAVAEDLGSAPREDELDGLFEMPWDVVEREGWTRLELYAQRGCRWGRCRFCSIGDRRVRAVSPSKVADIVAEALRRGIRSISFADDLFVQRPSWNRELLSVLDRRGLRADYRAQTTPNRTAWPLLRPMREVGFSELAFGLETLDARRAERMRKTLDGGGYVRQARETIRRVAAAGIHPVLYLIMADPTSDLPSIAGELRETVRLVSDVYRETLVLPKLSYSLTMLPVAGTEMTAAFAHRGRAVPCGEGDIVLPTEFELSRPVALYVKAADERTAGLPMRRENLAALPCYLEAVKDAAEALEPAQREAARRDASEGLALVHELMGRVDRDAAAAAHALVEVAGGRSAAIATDGLDHRRFDGYVPALQIFQRTLEEGLRALENAGGEGPRG